MTTIQTQTSAKGKVSHALVMAQKKFQPAIKNATNPHFRSKYADLATCVDAVIGALNENGIALVQQTHESSTGITVETVFVHESGETISGGKLYFPTQKNDPQGYMSALTYARRGSLMAACGIAPEDDDGNAASFSGGKESTDNGGKTAVRIPNTLKRSSSVSVGNIAEYKVTFGKFNGRKLSEIPSIELASYISWLKSDSEKKGKPLSLWQKEFVTMADNYLSQVVQTMSEKIRTVPSEKFPEEEVDLVDDIPPWIEEQIEEERLREK